MPDNADMLELAELEVYRLVDVMHRQGLNYHQIFRIFTEACAGIEARAEAENHLKGKHESRG